MKNTQDNKQTFLKLSVSSVETFQNCKARWYYRYILNLPDPKNYYSTVGSFIHKALEIFVKSLRKYKNIDKAESVALFLAKKDPELTPTLTDEIIEEGTSWLSQFVSKFKQAPETIPEVLSVEHPFNFKIEEDKVLIRGFIDRIDSLDNDTVQVIDYKTSKNPKYLKTFQLATYSIAIQQKYPEKKIKAAYELIRHGFQRQEHEVTEKERNKALAMFKQAASEIRELKKTQPNTPWPASPSKLCNYCPYQSRCERERTTKTPWKV